MVLVDLPTKLGQLFWGFYVGIDIPAPWFASGLVQISPISQWFMILIITTVDGDSSRFVIMYHDVIGIPVTARDIPVI